MVTTENQLQHDQVTVEFTETGEKRAFPRVRSAEIEKDKGPYLVDEECNADLILDATGRELPSGPWKVTE